MRSYGTNQDGILSETTYFLTTSATATATLTSSRAALESQIGPTMTALLGVSTGNLLVLKNPPILKTGIGIGLLRQPESFEPTTNASAEFEYFGGHLIDSLRACRA